MCQCMRNLDWLPVGEIKEVLEESHSFAGEVPVPGAQPSHGEQGSRCPRPGELGTAAPQPVWGDVFWLRASHAPPPACESPGVWAVGWEQRAGAYISGTRPVRDQDIECGDRFKLSGTWHSRKVIHLHIWRIWLHVYLWSPARYDLSFLCDNDARWGLGLHLIHLGLNTVSCSIWCIGNTCKVKNHWCSICSSAIHKKYF